MAAIHCMSFDGIPAPKQGTLADNLHALAPLRHIRNLKVQRQAASGLRKGLHLLALWHADLRAVLLHIASADLLFAYQWQQHQACALGCICSFPVGFIVVCLTPFVGSTLAWRAEEAGGAERSHNTREDVNEYDESWGSQSLMAWVEPALSSLLLCDQDFCLCSIMSSGL